LKSTSRTALFGPYALDLRSGELRELGIRVKMGEQAFQILRMLLVAPGEMVTREELRADDTFVDFDHGLNSAVQRLRDSLSDSAGKPRWIETVPRRGYRFVGQVEWSDEAISSDPLAKPGDGNSDEGSAGQVQSVDKDKLDIPSVSSPRPTTSARLGRRIAILVADMSHPARWPRSMPASTTRMRL
jgi:DNA-binding winged helix-turn-helix (wHTH) protein